MILKALFVNATISGGGHLWFIPTIMMCYLLTPLIQDACDYFDNRKILGIFIIIFAIIITFYLFSDSYNFAWILCYFMGYIINRWKSKVIKNVVIAWSLMNLLQIYADYVLHVSYEGIVYSLYNKWCNINHVALGICIFLLLKKIFSSVNFYKNRKICSMLNFSDAYSYEQYLVHQFMILGPLSLMKLTAYTWLNVVIIFILTIALSIILKKIEGIIKHCQNNLIQVRMKEN